MKKFFLLLLLFTTTACAQVLIDGVSGFSNKRIFLGLNGGGIEYDKDSSAYKLFYENKLGSLDSAWIVISSRASTPWAVNLEAQQRADADGNLLAQILLKASVVSVDSLRSRMTSAESSILLKASRLEVDGLRDSVWAEIVLKASIASVNALANSLENAEAAIQLKADKVYVDSLGLVYVSLINLKANVNSVDTLRGRMTNAEASILLKANQTFVEELGTSLSSQIALKASILVADTLKNRMTTAEAGISANASAITGLDGEVSNVVASLLLYAKKDSVISYVNISPGTIKISASKIELDGTAIADSLFGQVIIAPVIRTSASGAGIVLNGATNRLEFLNADGTVGSYLDASGGNIHLGGTISNDGTITGGVIQTSTSAVNQVKIFHDGTAGRIRFSNSSGLTIGDIIGYTDLSDHDWIQILSDVKANNFETSGYVLATGNIATLGDFYMNGDLVASQTWVNGRGFITGFTETDPLIYSWAKAATKPSYTYSEVGAASSTHNHDASYTTPGWVAANFSASGHGHDGTTIDGLTVADFTSANISQWTNNAGYLITETDPSVYAWAKAASKPSYTYSEVGAASSTHNHDASYTTPGWVAANFSASGHGHDGTTIDGLTVADFTSANISQWTNNAGYLITETDPSVYAWAKAATKPSYTYSEVGAQVAGSYQAQLSGTGFVKISGTTISYDNSTYTTPGWVAANFTALGHGHDGTTISDLTVADFTSANISQWTNNAGYLITETDPSVYAWAKAASKPSYTYSEVGAAAAFTGVTTYIEVYDETSSSILGLTFTNGILSNVQ